MPETELTNQQQLGKCPDCNHPVSYTAPTCPSCGAQLIPTRAISPIILTILFPGLGHFAQDRIRTGLGIIIILPAFMTYLIAMRIIFDVGPDSIFGLLVFLYFIVWIVSLIDILNHKPLTRAQPPPIDKHQPPT